MINFYEKLSLVTMLLWLTFQLRFKDELCFPNVAFGSYNFFPPNRNKSQLPFYLNSSINLTPYALNL